LCILVFGVTACGRKEHTETETQHTQTDADIVQELYMITMHDTKEESLCLSSLDTGMEHYYVYGMSTRFKDKYGNISSSIAFTPGRVVTIGEVDNDECLTEVRISDEVWEYEKVRHFSVDEEKGIFTIADTKYSIRDKVMIFSNGKQIPFSFLSEDDVLTVVGKEKKILSINVTTGHGTLELSNTDVFQDSFLQLNTDIFALITGDMDMELPEGTYTLKVANDGWGGTKEIEILRNETTKVDLETMKGEGKKKGLISFDIDVEDVEVYIDYQLIDHTKAVELTYGTHVLQIKAEGYDPWKNYLSVNSEEATLVIELTEEEEKEAESSQKEDASSSEAESEKKDNTETTESESETQNDTEATESKTA